MNLTELETYFNTNTLPKSIRLNKYSVITDVKSYVQQELNTIKTYGIEHKLSKLPIKRLTNLIEILEL